MELSVIHSGIWYLESNLIGSATFALAGREKKKSSSGLTRAGSVGRVTNIVEMPVEVFTLKMNLEVASIGIWTRLCFKRKNLLGYGYSHLVSKHRAVLSWFAASSCLAWTFSMSNLLKLPLKIVGKFLLQVDLTIFCFVYWDTVTHTW